MLKHNGDGIPNHIVGERIVIGEAEQDGTVLGFIRIVPLGQCQLLIRILANEQRLLAIDGTLRNGHQAKVNVRVIGNEFLTSYYIRLIICLSGSPVRTRRAEIHPIGMIAIFRVDDSTINNRRFCVSRIDCHHVITIIDSGVAIIERLDAEVRAFTQRSGKRDGNIGSAEVARTITLGHKHAFTIEVL